MKQRMETWTIIAFAVCLVIAFSPSQMLAQTATISGPGPFIITQNTQLVGDVGCSAVAGLACITFAAPNLQLDLNGFTIKGPTSCSGPAHGIATSGQARAQIKGPGKVENFLSGITVNGSKSRVRKIVAIRNCGFGIDVEANQVEIRDNIVLNTFNPLFATTAISIHGNENAVQENEVHGNKLTGISVFGTSNQIKKNSVTTNAIGIVLFGSNNTMDENLALNNTSLDIDDNGVGNTVTQQNVC